MGVSSALRGKGDDGWVIEVVVLLGTVRESWFMVGDVGVLAEVWATVQRYKASEHAFASLRGPSLDGGLA